MEIPAEFELLRYVRACKGVAETQRAFFRKRCGDEAILKPAQFSERVADRAVHRDVPNIDLLDANLAARKIGPHKGGSDRRERAFVGKRSDDGAAKIPPRFGRDDCREVHRDVARCEGFEPPSFRSVAERYIQLS